MEVSAPSRPITVAELLHLDSDTIVEVVNGELVHVAAVGVLHHLIAGNIYDLLKSFVRQQNLGFVFFDNLMYVLSAEGDAVRLTRIPDVSFVRRDAVPADFDLERPFPGAPTLAVEVMSPSDTIEETLERVRDYLEHDTAEVWVVFPRQREVHCYLRGAAQVMTYSGEDTMDVSALFPGLTLRLTDIFALPEMGK